MSTLDVSVPDRERLINSASVWLHENRAQLNASVIPPLRERFGLTTSEAIEAAKQSHHLAHPVA